MVEACCHEQDQVEVLADVFNNGFATQTTFDHDPSAACEEFEDDGNKPALLDFDELEAEEMAREEEVEQILQGQVSGVGGITTTGGEACKTFLHIFFYIFTYVYVYLHIFVFFVYIYIYLDCFHIKLIDWILFI